MRLKPGSNIGNQNPGPHSVSVLKLFYPKPKPKFFSNLIMFFYFFGGYKFFKLEIFKNKLKSLIFGSKFGFRGPFTIEKIPHTYY